MMTKVESALTVCAPALYTLYIPLCHTGKSNKMQFTADTQTHAFRPNENHTKQAFQHLIICNISQNIFNNKYNEIFKTSHTTFSPVTVMLYKLRNLVQLKDLRQGWATSPGGRPNMGK